MAHKKFFRWLRGELNGYYLNKIAYFVNDWVEDYISPVLAYFLKMQFRSDSDEQYGNINNSDIKGIAKFAGITQLITKGIIRDNVMYFTSSHKVGNEEQSFSGLFNKAISDFSFGYKDKRSDINSFATEELQTSLVEEGAEILGYIPEDAEVYDIDGNFNKDAVLPVPPEGKAYVPFYGLKYLQLQENLIVNYTIPIEQIYDALVAIQNIRRNGATIYTFFELTRIFGIEFIKIEKFVSHGLYIEVMYSNLSVEVQNRQMKQMLWEYVIKQFFPQFQLTNVTK